MTCWREAMKVSESMTGNKFTLFMLLLALNIVGVLALASALRLSVSTTTFIFWMVAMVWLALIMTVLGLRASHKPDPQQQLHAAIAAKVAGRRRDALLDIGFIGFWGKNSMYTYRTQPVPTSAETLQPYVQIRSKRRRTVRVEFDILNDLERLVFRREVQLRLEAGVHFVTPPARLRLGQHVPLGQWTLEVRVNNILMARHQFSWVADEVMSVEGHLNADGEVDEQIAALLVDNYAAPLSLDDLLTGEETRTTGNKNAPID